MRPKFLSWGVLKKGETDHLLTLASHFQKNTRVVFMISSNTWQEINIFPKLFNDSFKVVYGQKRKDQVAFAFIRFEDLETAASLAVQSFVSRQLIRGKCVAAVFA